MNLQTFVRAASAFVMALAAAMPLHAELSVDTLLNDMVDLDRLARLPEPAYVTRQFSSYNRASVSASDPAGWFANRDRGHFLRTEERGAGQELVMMDAEGPGAIVRVWSASDKGTLRFYFDGNPAPAIEATIPELLGGAYPGLPVPLAGQRARGWNLYFPLPYARHCKITCDNPQMFYHVNYRTYPAGTPVRSFEPGDLERLADRIAQVARRLESPRSSAQLPPERRTTEFDVALQPGARVELLRTQGPASICEWVVSVDAARANLEHALRACVLEMTFDGRRTVECPLGDFFGTAPGLTAYEGLPLGITDEPVPQMWCHWRMPFAETAAVHVRNLGPVALQLRGRVAVAPGRFDDRTFHFHAGWRIERDIPSRPFSDWTHLECQGNGRFVGGALHIMNPVRRWWGEGDEKIYVDGEAFPSHFGTGSEDYYGYAWCSPERFVHAYHNQPRCDGPGNYGHTSVNRFHILDDIPFTKSFRFDMENWHHNPITRTTRAVVSYWYARPGGTASLPAIARQEVAPVEVPPFEIPKVAHAIEGEDLRVLSEGPNVAPSSVDERFSSGRHLVWREARRGERVDLALDADQAGERRVRIRLVLHRQGPRLQLHLNGRPAGPAIDLSHERTTPTESEIDLDRHELAASGNRLSIEVLGPGEKTPADMEAFIVGLDYVRLTPD